MNTNINEKSKDLFSRFCEKLGGVDLRMAVAVPAMIGCAIVIYGIGQEVQGQDALLAHGGYAALDVYKAAMHSLSMAADAREKINGEWSELNRLVANSFAGRDQSFGGNMQVVGVVSAYVGPAISASAVLLARGFGKAKEFLTEKAGQFMKAQPQQRENDQVMPLARTFGGSSLVMAGIGANKESHPGFFSEERQQEIHQEDAPSRMRPA